MKNIILKLTSIKEMDKEVSYVDLMKVCLNKPVREGFSLSEMEARLKVLKKINELTPSEVSLSLEDAEAAKLKECVEAMVWGALHEDIVEFVNTVKTACA